MIALQPYTATSTTKVTTADAVSAKTTAIIIISASPMRIMLCPHGQLYILPLKKDEVMPEGPTSICQALSPLQILKKRAKSSGA